METLCYQKNCYSEEAGFGNLDQVFICAKMYQESMLNIIFNSRFQGPLLSSGLKCATHGHPILWPCHP